MTTPAQQKAAKAARQARWRARKAAQAAAAAQLGVTIAEVPLPPVEHKPKARFDDTVLDMVHAAVEKGVDVFDRDVQGALKLGLTAQAQKDKREQKTKQENFWFGLGAALAGASLASVDDVNIIEGTARDVTPGG